MGDQLIIMSFRVPNHSNARTVDVQWTVPLDDLPPRPMSNCLRPCGAGPTHLTMDKVDIPSILCTRIPDSITDPMPSCIGHWIHTFKGYRRLFSDELAKGLGIPKGWMKSNPATLTLKSPVLNITAGVHLWEVLGRSLSDAKIDRVKVFDNEAVLDEPTKLPQDNNGPSTKGFLRFGSFLSYS